MASKKDIASINGTLKKRGITLVEGDERHLGLKRDLPALKGKKRAMFIELIASLGLVTKSAEKVGISRRTHAYWLNSDPVYKAWVEELPEIKLDFYEEALNRLVNDGNVTAVIFALKTQGRGRGYIETKDIRHDGNIEFGHRLLQELSEDE